MKPTYDLITIGGATWDAIVKAEEEVVLEEAGNRFLSFPYGQKLYLDQAYFDFGGGAANVSVSASRLGLRVSFVGAVGAKPLGDSVLEHFRQEGVATKYAKQDENNLNGMSLVLAGPDGERTILLYRGANSYLSDADINWKHCVDTKWLYVSSLSGESDSLYNKVTKLAEANHLQLVLNPGETQIHRGPKGLHDALERAQVLLLNEDESRELLRQRGTAGETVIEMLQTLQTITGGVVVITQAAQGAQAFDGTHYYQIAAFSTKRVNALGAGDAFGSTFVTGMAKGLGVAEALRYASVNASAVVADFGAQKALLTWPELEQRVQDAKKYQPKISKR